MNALLAALALTVPILDSENPRTDISVFSPLIYGNLPLLQGQPVISGYPISFYFTPTVSGWLDRVDIGLDFSSAGSTATVVLSDGRRSAEVEIGGSWVEWVSFVFADTPVEAGVEYAGLLDLETGGALPWVQVMDIYDPSSRRAVRRIWIDTEEYRSERSPQVAYVTTPEPKTWVLAAICLLALMFHWRD
jgi:hypothetical protein